MAGTIDSNFSAGKDKYYDDWSVKEVLFDRKHRESGAKITAVNQVQTSNDGKLIALVAGKTLYLYDLALSSDSPKKEVQAYEDPKTILACALHPDTSLMRGRPVSEGGHIVAYCGQSCAVRLRRYSPATDNTEISWKCDYERLYKTANALRLWSRPCTESSGGGGALFVLTGGYDETLHILQLIDTQEGSEGARRPVLLLHCLFKLKGYVDSIDIAEIPWHEEDACDLKGEKKEVGEVEGGGDSCCKHLMITAGGRKMKGLFMVPVTVDENNQIIPKDSPGWAASIEGMTSVNQVNFFKIGYIVVGHQAGKNDEQLPSFTTPPMLTGAGGVPATGTESGTSLIGDASTLRNSQMPVYSELSDKECEGLLGKPDPSTTQPASPTPSIHHGHQSSHDRQSSPINTEVDYSDSEDEGANDNNNLRLLPSSGSKKGRGVSDTPSKTIGSSSGLQVIQKVEHQELMCTAHIFQHEDCVRAVCFSPERTRLAWGGENAGRLFLWEVGTRNLRETKLGFALYASSFSPDGQLLCAGGAAATLLVLDVQTGSGLYRFQQDFKATVTCCAFSPGGTWLLAGSKDGCAVLRQLREGGRRDDLGVDEEGAASSSLKAAFMGGELLLAPRALRPGSGQPSGCTVAALSGLTALVREDHALEVFENRLELHLPHRRVLRKLQEVVGSGIPNGGGDLAVGISPDGSVLVYHRYMRERVPRGKFKAWQKPADKSIKEFKRHTLPTGLEALDRKAYRLSISSQNDFILYDDDSAVFVSSIMTQKIHQPKKNQKNYPYLTSKYTMPYSVWSSCIQPGPKTNQTPLIAVGYGSFVQVFLPKVGDTFEERFRGGDHGDNCTTCAFSNDGSKLITGSRDKHVRVFHSKDREWKEGNLVLDLEEDSPIGPCAFYDLGTRALIAASTKTGIVSLWEMKVEDIESGDKGSGCSKAEKIWVNQFAIHGREHETVLNLSMVPVSFDPQQEPPAPDTERGLYLKVVTEQAVRNVELEPLLHLGPLLGAFLRSCELADPDYVLRLARKHRYLVHSFARRADPPRLSEPAETAGSEPASPAGAQRQRCRSVSVPDWRLLSARRFSKGGVNGGGGGGSGIGSKEGPGRGSYEPKYVSVLDHCILKNREDCLKALLEEFPKTALITKEDSKEPGCQPFGPVRTAQAVGNQAMLKLLLKAAFSDKVRCFEREGLTRYFLDFIREYPTMISDILKGLQLEEYSTGQAYYPMTVGTSAVYRTAVHWAPAGVWDLTDRPPSGGRRQQWPWRRQANKAGEMQEDHQPLVHERSSAEDEQWKSLKPGDCAFERVSDKNNVFFKMSTIFLGPAVWLGLQWYHQLLLRFSNKSSIHDSSSQSGGHPQAKMVKMVKVQTSVVPLPIDDYRQFLQECVLTAKKYTPAIFDNPCIENILHALWKGYFQRIFYFVFFQYAATFVLSLIFTILYAWKERETVPDDREYNIDLGLIVVDFCLVYLGGLNIAFEAKQFSYSKHDYIADIGWNLIHWTLYSLLVAVGALHMKLFFVGGGGGDAVAICSALAIILAAINLLFYLKGFKHMGGLVRMLERVIMELVWFLLVVFFILVSFSAAFYVLFLGGGGSKAADEGSEEDTQGAFGSYWETLFTAFTMMVGEFDTDAFGAAAQPELFTLLFVAYMFIIAVVMLNFIIAVLSDTYEKVKESEKQQMLFEKAGIILELYHYLTGRELDYINQRKWVHVMTSEDQLVKNKNKSRVTHHKEVQDLLRKNAHELRGLEDRLKNKNAQDIQGLEDRLSRKFEEFYNTLEKKGSAY